MSRSNFSTGGAVSGLLSFLGNCQATARLKGPRLASYSFDIELKDPIAALDATATPQERRFYVSRENDDAMLAGIGQVLGITTSGPGRFAAGQRFVDDTLAMMITGGSSDFPVGPYFFAAFTFFDEVQAGEPFPAANLFLPQWQVVRRNGRSFAVANALIDDERSMDALAETWLRFMGKLAKADGHGGDAERRPGTPPQSIAEVGAPGAYDAAVREALKQIANGNLEKVVLARAQDVVVKAEIAPFRVMQELRREFPECYAFLVANGAGQNFIGASPERLLRVCDGHLFTEAQAGSAPRGPTAKEDAALAHALLRDEKEAREHQMVVRSITEGLATLGLEATTSGIPEIRRLPNVQHMYTPIRASLPTACRLMDVLAELHPTPAVGGRPRDRALARIRGGEPFSRGLYAGALGWIDARGEGEFFVGLRAALVEGARARLYAGAGIVAGSVPENEWKETELKFMAARNAILGRPPCT